MYKERILQEPGGMKLHNYVKLKNEPQYTIMITVTCII